ncbi:MAG: serine protease [Planctomycetaceae bacterium]|nr:serine protease [Planctomycetaceae bacterium]
MLSPPQALAASLRRSAIVKAVQSARPSVVNIHGQKTVPNEDDGRAFKQVRGMGTGIVIDERGYIITNYHVVEGVKRVQVSTAKGKTYIARLIAHDPPTDLAVIKIDADPALPLITIGTSNDLLTGEDVIAIGNAYGYEHTVTKGIISALHRTVEVGEGQEYSDLIQTDASINPGNSGGPLLNIDGNMIGINVAVRVGAQGIGFAVPIDRAMDVAARLIDVEVQKAASHGVSGQTLATATQSEFLITAVAAGSGADKAGLLPGDVITRVGSASVVRALDFERALLGKQGGEKVELAARRNGDPIHLDLVLSHPATADRSVSELAWDVLGMRLAPMPNAAFRRLRSQYRGGLKVIGVRPDSPAARQGIRYGDVLVGMHKWETVSMDNVAFVLESDVLDQEDAVKFYVLRGGETLFGRLQVSMRSR